MRIRAFFVPNIQYLHSHKIFCCETKIVEIQLKRNETYLWNTEHWWENDWFLEDQIKILAAFWFRWISKDALSYSQPWCGSHFGRPRDRRYNERPTERQTLLFWRGEITTLTYTHTSACVGEELYLKTTSHKQDWRKTKARWKRVKWSCDACACLLPPRCCWKYINARPLFSSVCCCCWQKGRKGIPRARI
jgi:hypothetical protein